MADSEVAAAGDSLADASGPSADQVGRRVGVGVRWSLLNNVALRLGTFASGIVLARLLGPGEYGVFAIALVVLTLLQSMNELGVSLAIVRWEGDVRRFAPTVMTIAGTSSLVMYVGCFLGAPAIASAFGSPDATTVIRVLCLGVLVDGVATVPAGILNREFQQRRRLYCDLASFVVTTSLTVGLAVAGAGAMSFAIGRLAGNVAMLAGLQFASPIRVRPGWDASLVRPLLRFGLPLAGASLLALAITNVDNIIVGSMLDPVALGLYLMAFNQSSWPLTVFSDAARRVSLAGFSRLVANPPGLQRAFTRGLWLLLAAATPVCVGLIVYAEPLLQVLYGGRWVPAAPALRWLAALGLIRVALFVGYDCLVALGRSRRLIALQAVWLVSLLPTLVIGVRIDGIRGAAIAHVLVAVVVVLPAFLVTLRGVGIRPATVARGGARPALGGLLAAASAWPVLHYIDAAFWQLVVGGLVLLAVYLPVVIPMRQLMPGHRPGRHRGAGRAPIRRTSGPRTVLPDRPAWSAGPIDDVSGTEEWLPAGRRRSP